MLLGILFVSTSALSGQKADSNRVLTVETSVFATGSEAPLFLHMNQLGRFDERSSNAVLGIGYHYGKAITENVRLRFNTRLNGRISDRSAFFFEELEAQISTPLGSLKIGRYIEEQGLSSEFLGPASFGSMMVSRNATPPFRISYQSPGFQPVPFTYGFLRWRGTFTHGWMGGNRYVENVLLHQKSFYLNLNLWIFQGYGGFIHNVVWGGTHPEFGTTNPSFANFFRVVSGLGGGGNQPFAERNNSLGNSVAAYDYGFRLDLTKVVFHVYRLFYVEDSPGLRYRSPWDGVWGGSIEFSDPILGVQRIGYEHVFTKHQGRRQDLDPPDPLGADNYYNHFYYQSGWTHFGRVLGLPLMLTNPGLENPFFTANDQAITNNIIVAHHSFIEGEMGVFKYRINGIFSRNYGTLVDQKQLGQPGSLSGLRKDQMYMSLLISKTVDHSVLSDVRMQIAGDTGDLWKRNFGALITLRFKIDLKSSLNI